ncbi:MAG: type II secretion system F family protein [Phycisphaerae bacterium]
MILTYEAVDANGRRTGDAIEAADIRGAVAELRRQGLFVTEIKEQPVAAHQVRADAATPRSPRLPIQVLTLLTRQMAMLLSAGSAVVPALTSLRRQMTKPDHVAVLDRLIADLEEGVPLAESLQKHPKTFDAVYCAIVAAGEASASLGASFQRLAVIVGQRNAMRKQIVGALAYPSLLMCMSASIFAVMLFFVMPRFGAMFEQLSVDMPASTEAMLALAGVFRSQWPALAGAAAMLVTGVVLVVRNERARLWLSNAALRVPLLGHLISQVIQAQVFRTMGVLLGSSVGVLETLELARGISRTDRFIALFGRLEEAIVSGGQLSAAFEESGIVDASVCQAIRTGEDSGNLSGAITYCADVLDETNTELIGAATRLIEPLILIVMGVIVGTVAVSLFMPLFDMTSAIG